MMRVCFLWMLMLFFCISLDHWVYDFENEARVTASKLNKFLTSYDGVHILLKDRTEVGKHKPFSYLSKLIINLLLIRFSSGKFFISDRKFSRTHDPKWVYGDYTPSHLHHNWRFNNIYEQHAEMDKKL